VLLRWFLRTSPRGLHTLRLPATLQIQAGKLGCTALSRELKPLQGLEPPKPYTARRTVMSTLRLTIDGRTFRDSDNRQVTLRGINVAADAKYPASPDLPSNILDKFFDGDNVSFVGRPFTLEEADMHFARLRHWGYNTIRYIFTWEAIESVGPGNYDEEWVKSTISVLRLAKEYGFYIFMDPHQDVVCCDSSSLYFPRFCQSF
jgi:hypothetical protein